MKITINGHTINIDKGYRDVLEISGIPMLIMHGGPVIGICHGIMPSDGTAPEPYATIIVNDDSHIIQFGTWALFDGNPRTTSRNRLVRMPESVRRAVDGCPIAPDDERLDSIKDWGLSMMDDEGRALDRNMTGSPFVFRCIPPMALKRYLRGQVEDPAADRLTVTEQGWTGCHFYNADGTPFRTFRRFIVGNHGYRSKHYPKDGDPYPRGGGFADLFSKPLPFVWHDGNAETGLHVAHPLHFTVDALLWIAAQTADLVAWEIAMNQIRAAMTMYDIDDMQGAPRGHGWMANAVGLALSFAPGDVELAYYARVIGNRLRTFNSLHGMPRGAVFSTLARDKPIYNAPPLLDKLGGGPLATEFTKTVKPFQQAILVMGLIKLHGALGQFPDIQQLIKEQLDIAAHCFVVQCHSTAYIDESGNLWQREADQAPAYSEFAAAVVGVGTDVAPFGQKGHKNAMNGVAAGFDAPALAMLAEHPEYQDFREGVMLRLKWLTNYLDGTSYYGTNINNFNKYIDWMLPLYAAEATDWGQ